MFLILLTGILINLIIRSFQWEFASSKKYTIGLTIKTLQHLSIDNWKENYWIWELGITIPYCCNDKIDDIGILSSTTCRSVNVMDIFNSAHRHRRSHGHHRIMHPLYSMMLHKMTFYHLNYFHYYFQSVCLVQLVFGNLRYKYEFKWIQAYSNRLR